MNSTTVLLSSLPGGFSPPLSSFMSGPATSLAEPAVVCAVSEYVSMPMRPAVLGKKANLRVCTVRKEWEEMEWEKKNKTKSSALNPKSHEPEGEGVSQKRQHVSVRGTARGEPAGFISLACFFFFGLQKESGGGGGERAETERWRWGSGRRVRGGRN